VRGHWWTAVNSGPIESLQCVCVVVSTVSDSSLFNSSPWPCTATAARHSLVASGTVSYLQNCCHRLEASVVVPDCGLHQLAASSYGWDDSRSVTSAGWQVTLSSHMACEFPYQRSEAGLHYPCELLHCVYFTLLYISRAGPVFAVNYAVYGTLVCCTVEQMMSDKGKYSSSCYKTLHM